MEIVNCDQTACHCLLGDHQEVETSLGVVTTCTTATARVNGSKVGDTAAVLEIYLAPWNKGYTTPLKKE